MFGSIMLITVELKLKLKLNIKEPHNKETKIFIVELELEYCSIGNKIFNLPLDIGENRLWNMIFSSSKGQASMSNRLILFIY